MKKKGLIISTIVMVLVLAVSLTTATYAWFTVSGETTIKGFDVSVKSDRNVQLGLKTDNKFTADGRENSALYRFGTVDYTGTAGTFGGEWSGDNIGLGDEIDHQIVWGEQTKAVGVTSGEIAAATYGNTTLFTKPTEATNDGDAQELVTGNVVAANGQAYNENTAATLANVKLDDPVAAIANHGAAKAGDNAGYEPGHYAHLTLGVQPVKALTANNLVIFLDASGSASSNVGILAALHVAYRIDGGDWVDAQFFEGKWSDKKQNLSFEFEEDDDWGETTLANAYKASVEGATSVPAQAGAVIIALDDTNALDPDQEYITQVEIIIYLAGSDPDCNNQAAVNVSGKISIFFHTVAEVADNT